MIIYNSMTENRFESFYNKFRAVYDGMNLSNFIFAIVKYYDTILIKHQLIKMMIYFDIIQTYEISKVKNVTILYI